MSDTKKKNHKVQIGEGNAEWGENFALILHPEPPSCPNCHSINTNKCADLWLCNVCHTAWKLEAR